MSLCLQPPRGQQGAVAASLVYVVEGLKVRGDGGVEPDSTLGPLVCNTIQPLD